MISHTQFGQLRLSQFRHDSEIAELEDWEYEERTWVGEAIGFSEWLCPIDDPQKLGSLSINFGEFPDSDAEKVLQTLDLPIEKGMTAVELTALLGDPVEILRFVPGQVTLEYLTSGEEPFKVSCTVEDKSGLVFLGVMAAD